MDGYLYQYLYGVGLSQKIHWGIRKESIVRATIYFFPAIQLSSVTLMIPLKAEFDGK